MLNELALLAWLFLSLIFECLTLASSSLWLLYYEIIFEFVESKAFEFTCQRASLLGVE